MKINNIHNVHIEILVMLVELHHHAIAVLVSYFLYIYMYVCMYIKEQNNQQNNIKQTQKQTSVNASKAINYKNNHKH